MFFFVYSAFIRNGFKGNHLLFGYTYTYINDLILFLVTCDITLRKKKKDFWKNHLPSDYLAIISSDSLDF